MNYKSQVNDLQSSLDHVTNQQVHWYIEQMNVYDAGKSLVRNRWTFQYQY